MIGANRTSQTFFASMCCVLLLNSIARAQQETADDSLPPHAVVRIGGENGNLPSLRGTVLSSDGKTLVTYGEPANPKQSRTVDVWEVKTGKRLHSLSGHERPIRAVALSPDGKTLVSSSFDITEQTGITRIWDLKTGKSRKVIPEGGSTLWFSQNDGSFSLVVRDKLHVYRADTGDEVQRFLGPNLSLGASGDGRLLMSVSHNRDTVLRLFDVRKQSELGRLEGAKKPLRSAAIAADGRTVAGTDGGTVLAWEMISGQLVHQLGTPHRRIFAVAFSPDGRYLATAGLDKTARVWELATGEEVAKFTGHTGLITTLCFGDDSQTLATGGTDRTAFIWDVAGLLQSKIAGDSLSEERLNSVWQDLGGYDAKRAYLAMGTAWELDDQVLPYLRERVEAIMKPAQNKRIQKLIRDLDDDDSLVRDRASLELRKLRQVAKPVLIKVMNETPSLEVRLRIHSILSGYATLERYTSIDRRRMRRLIHALSHTEGPHAEATLKMIIDDFPVKEIVAEAERVLKQIGQ